MSNRKVFISLGFVITSVALAQVKVVRKPLSATSPASGHEMYAKYCASCHGRDGHGDGPAAAGLKVPPANLTLLTKRNNGKFPKDRVRTSIRGDLNSRTSGSMEMPVWGAIFLHRDGQKIAHQRIYNLTSYVEQLQQP